LEYWSNAIDAVSTCTNTPLLHSQGDLCALWGGRLPA
jgi:hypothetical protein